MAARALQFDAPPFLLLSIAIPSYLTKKKRYDATLFTLLKAVRKRMGKFLADLPSAVRVHSESSLPEYEMLALFTPLGGSAPQPH